MKKTQWTVDEKYWIKRAAEEAMIVIDRVTSGDEMLIRGTIVHMYRCLQHYDLNHKHLPHPRKAAK